MTCIARVISVVNMPCPAQAWSLTAVKMQMPGEESSVFFIDSPEAATLTAGEWIAFEPQNGPAPKLTKLSLAPELAPLTEVELTPAVVRQCISAYGSGSVRANNIPLADIERAIHDIQDARTAYGSYMLPTLILNRILPD